MQEGPELTLLPHEVICEENHLLCCGVLCSASKVKDASSQNKLCWVCGGGGGGGAEENLMKH